MVIVIIIRKTLLVPCRLFDPCSVKFYFRQLFLWGEFWCPVTRSRDQISFVSSTTKHDDDDEIFSTDYYFISAWNYYNSRPTPTLRRDSKFVLKNSQNHYQHHPACCCGLLIITLSCKWFRKSFWRIKFWGGRSYTILCFKYICMWDLHRL